VHEFSSRIYLETWRHWLCVCEWQIWWMANCKKWWGC